MSSTYVTTNIRRVQHALLFVIAIIWTLSVKQQSLFSGFRPYFKPDTLRGNDNVTTLKFRSSPCQLIMWTSSSSSLHPLRLLSLDGATWWMGNGRADVRLIFEKYQHSEMKTFRPELLSGPPTKGGVGYTESCIRDNMHISSLCVHSGEIR